VIRVLHIEDEAPIRTLARVNLEAEGVEVIEAANGRTGVQLAKREQPDLILLGVMMPVLDGWQAAQELSKDRETREIPIVFLTARSEPQDRARGFDLGAIDYITKPFNPAELAPRLRGLLERLERGERDELRREKISELRALMDGTARLAGLSSVSGQNAERLVRFLLEPTPLGAEERPRGRGTLLIPYAPIGTDRACRRAPGAPEPRARRRQ
jgi:DNA-binding response OmpR family regulator